MGVVLGILSFLGALAPVLSAILGALQRQSDKEAGAQIEAGAASQAAARTQAAIAQAGANAPRSQAALVAAMKAGSF